MKKLFISQPMRGLTNEQILSKREYLRSLAVEILGEELEVIDSFFKDAPTEAKPLWYISKSIEMLTLADIVIFDEDAFSYRGCNIEYQSVVGYHVNHIEVYRDYDGKLQALLVNYGDTDTDDDYDIIHIESIKEYEEDDHGTQRDSRANE